MALNDRQPIVTPNGKYVWTGAEGNNDPSRIYNWNFVPNAGYYAAGLDGNGNPVVGDASAEDQMALQSAGVNQGDQLSGWRKAASDYAAPLITAAVGGMGIAGAMGGAGALASGAGTSGATGGVGAGSTGFAGLNAAGSTGAFGGMMSTGGAGMASTGILGGYGTTAGLIGSGLLSAGTSLYGSSMASDAARDAANTAAGASDRATAASLQAQREQLAYLQDVDKMPREYREAALAKLNETYNAPGGFQYPQEQMIQSAQNSPLYDAIMGGQKAGEDAILRNQAMTGGFRSGNMQSNLNEFNTGLKNSALLTAYDEQKQNYNQGLAGLGGLAGLQGQTSNISNVMGQMGQTSAAGIMNSGNIMAQGITAQGQAYQQGLQGLGNAIGSTAGNYLYAKGKGIL